MPIAGEFVASTSGNTVSCEVASLDNVMLTPGPALSIALLMSLGALGICAVCRRTRSSRN